MGELMPVENLTRKHQKKITKGKNKTASEKNRRCVDGESDPGFSRGRREFYQSTTEPPTPSLVVIYH